MKRVVFLLICFYASYVTAEQHESSYISGDYIPYLKEESKSRTAPFFGLEIGDKFLSPGPIEPGNETITGAIWQPRLWFYGSYRSSFYSYDKGKGSPQTTEWANRLDLYGNLQLSGTERILIGIQPLHHKNNFYGYTFDSSEDNGVNNSTNLNFTTLFFEGDISELFPKLDSADSKGLDIGFSIGRQLLNIQNGILLNDTVDAIGLTKNTIRFENINWLTNLQLTTIYAWNQVNRHDNEEDQNSKIFGISAKADTIWSTIELDTYLAIGDEDSQDLFALGLSHTKRVNQYNWTFRYNASQALENTSPQSRSGHLIVNEISWTPPKSDDVIYINTILGLDHFSSIARDDLSGGPMGAIGLSFAATGLGSYPSALNDDSTNTIAASIGYQMFFDANKQYILFEMGQRLNTDSDGEYSTSLGAQWQMSFAKRYMIQLDGFLAHEDSDIGFGLRTEFKIKF